MDAFFASVEQNDFPELRGKPLVVGGDKERRGVVAAASYEARVFGIHSAMSMGEAYRRCPHLVRQPVRMARYKEISEQVRVIFLELTDLVEPLSIDEAFLDVTIPSQVLERTATLLAHDLKSTIFRQTGLTVSAGVAPNKFLAKVASDMNKPNGLTVVQPHQVEDFLEPLPVKRIWGVGPATNQRLALLGITTIGELRALSLEEALDHFGKSGLHYYRLSRGLDDRPVQSRGLPKSLSTERTFSLDVTDPNVLREHLWSQSQEVAQSCQKRRLSGGTVVLKLRYDDFSTITRSFTMAEPSRAFEDIYHTALELLEKTEYKERPIRLMGVGLSGLLSDDRPVQLLLPNIESE